MLTRILKKAEVTILVLTEQTAEQGSVAMCRNMDGLGGHYAK